MKTLFTSLLLVGFLFAGCSTNKKANSTSSSNSNTQPKVELPDIVVSFEQTACFGSCPVHKMVIHGNGKATYYAERNTKLEGNFIGSFSEKEIQDIFKKMDELSFFSNQSEYTEAVTDMPTSIIYMNTGKQKHQVIAYFGYPDNVKEAIQFLYGITQNHKWKEEEK